MAERGKKVNVHPRASETTEPAEAIAPRVDIYDTEDGRATVLVAEIPGATHETTDVRVDKGVLTISADGRGDPPGESYARIYTGFVRGEYFRAFALSDEVDRDKIEASLTDGVLTVRLPQAGEARRKKIEIKSQ